MKSSIRKKNVMAAANNLDLLPVTVVRNAYAKTLSPVFNNSDLKMLYNAKSSIHVHSKIIFPVDL